MPNFLALASWGFESHGGRWLGLHFTRLCWSYPWITWKVQPMSSAAHVRWGSA